MSTDLEDLATALARRAELATPRHELDAVLRDATQRQMPIDPGLVPGSLLPDAPPRWRLRRRPVPNLVSLVTRRRPRGVVVMALVAAIAGVAAIGFAASRGGGDGSVNWGRADTDEPVPTTPRLRWVMPHAVLAAESIIIDYAGDTFAPPPEASAQSRLLSRSEELIQVTWSERGVNVTWEMSLRLRGEEWWVEQMAVYGSETTGAGPPTDAGMPVIHLDDDSGRTRLGEALTGVIDLTATSAGESARVRIAGLTLLGFRDRGPHGDAVPVGTTLVALAPAPPLPDDVAPTGMYVPVRDWIGFSVAQDTLVSECMAAAGFELPVMPDETIVQLYGQFESSAGLSVQGRRAATASGYHSADPTAAFAWFDAAVEQVPLDRRDAFHDARLRCESESSTALGWTGDSGPMRAWGVVGDIRQEAYGDPVVIAALETWGRCVHDAVGERAANPNELARMYAFSNGEPTEGSASEHEKAVAVADLDCQRQVDWETVWYTAVVERERAAMGERVGEYDQWVREYQAVIARAQQVLDERGIVLPSLD